MLCLPRYALKTKERNLPAEPVGPERLCGAVQCRQRHLDADDGRWDRHQPGLRLPDLRPLARAPTSDSSLRVVPCISDGVWLKWVGGTLHLRRATTRSWDIFGNAGVGSLQATDR